MLDILKMVSEMVMVHLVVRKNKSGLETVYVGDWVNDMKSGYGVLDYVIR